MKRKQFKFIAKRTNTGRNCLYIEGDDLIPPHLEDYRFFTIDTFTNISLVNNSVSMWDIILGIIGTFIDTLEFEHKQKIARFLVASNYAIRNADPELLHETLVDISKVLIDLDDQVKLFEKLKAWSYDNVNFGDLDKVGEADQDTEELTFREDDVAHVVATIMLSKLLTPIFGETMDAIIKRNGSAEFKELHTSIIMSGVLHEHYPKFMRKFEFYIANQISKINNWDMTRTHQGITPSTLKSQVTAHILTRNFVNADLYRPTSVPMKFFYSAINCVIKSQTAAGKKPRVMEHIDPATKYGAESKKSQLEIDSVTTTKPADVLILTNALTDSIVESFLVQYELSKELYDECLGYYLQRTVVLNDINRFIVMKVFGPEYGSALSINNLNVEGVTKLLTLLTLLAHKFGYYELMHGVVSSLATVTKSRRTREDDLIVNNYKSSTAFKNLMTIFTESPLRGVSSKFDNTMKEIAKTLTTNIYLCNTAPALLDLIYGDDGMGLTGNRLIFTEEYIRSVCELAAEI